MSFYLDSHLKSQCPSAVAAITSKFFCWIQKNLSGQSTDSRLNLILCDQLVKSLRIPWITNHDESQSKYQVFSPRAHRIRTKKFQLTESFPVVWLHTRNATWCCVEILCRRMWISVRHTKIWMRRIKGTEKLELRAECYPLQVILNLCFQ